MLAVSLTVGLCGEREAVELRPVGCVTTWPDSSFRWMDIADNFYAESYRNSFNYSSPRVKLTYEKSASTFQGELTGKGLKSGFAYQMKLVGKPAKDMGARGDDISNERIGAAGRWWRKKPDPSNTNDADVEAHRQDPGYIFEGYFYFGYFVTDWHGLANVKFKADSSYHVTWKKSQREPGPNDSKPMIYYVEVDAGSPAYGRGVEGREVSLYCEWEPGRTKPGELQLPPGDYNVTFLLTEESFHGKGLAGYWRAAMAADDVRFRIVEE